MSKEKKAPARCFLYSLGCPTGQIFVGDEAIDGAIDQGWKETPPPPERLEEHLLAQAIEESQAEGSGSAIETLTEANKALADELETATKSLQAAEKRADDAEKKLAAAVAKGGKGAGK